MLICLDLRTHKGCGTKSPNGTRFCPECGKDLHYALKLHDLEDMIGRYCVRDLIGYGGYGAVYAVEAQQQRYALKATFDSDSIRVFETEFTILKRLTHDNLPRYYEWFEADGNGYLVMELVAGQNLEDILHRQRGPLPQSQVLGYAVQLCDVLSYLHTQTPPIFHRDLKPANIRFTPEGLLKLVDFGLLKQGSEMTATPLRGLGSAGYTPLEQYGGEGQHTDQRSDLYSLGATLYHLLTGEKPPSATSADSLLPADELNPALAPHVAAALGKALSRLQADRYQSVASFKVALLHAGTPERIQRLLPAMVEVPAGPFLMGSSDRDKAAYYNEKPQHTLILPRYWIGKTPITNAQFRPFVEGDGYTNQAYWTSAGWQWRETEKIVKPAYWDNAKWNGADYPVVGVSWFEAVAYCRWLTKQTDIEFRLPSEAEWEKAARGLDGRIYPWGNTWENRRCNAAKGGFFSALGRLVTGHTTPVHNYPTGASLYGALDMAGNVCEWCATQSQKPYPYQLEDEWQPAYLEAGTSRVLRGGGYWDTRVEVRGAYRNDNTPRDRNLSKGLRVASHSLRADSGS